MSFNLFFIEHGNCAKINRETKDDVWLYFLADPTQPEMVSRAREICRGCKIRVECLNYHLDNWNEVVIAGGLTPYERKLLKWKRVDSVGESNWRSVSELAGNLG